MRNYLPQSFIILDYFSMLMLDLIYKDLLFYEGILEKGVPAFHAYFFKRYCCYNENGKYSCINIRLCFIKKNKDDQDNLFESVDK